MKHLRILVVTVVALPLISTAIFERAVNSQLSGTTDQANRVSNTGITISPSIAVPTPPPGIDNEGVDPNSTNTFSFDTDQNSLPDPSPTVSPCQVAVAPAPADFAATTNGFLPQGSPVPQFTDPDTLSHTTFNNDRFVFSAVEEIEDGLGPVYNAQSCRECHQNPTVGGISQVNELRAGHNVVNTQPLGVEFVDAPGGSLINDRAIPSPGGVGPQLGSVMQERVPPLFTAGVMIGGFGGGSAINQEEPVRTFRTSLNVLGDGFVEAIANGTLLSISNAQANRTGGLIQGQVIAVPVLEANIDTNPDCIDPSQPCQRRIGRFSWKNQHASLLSFSGDAYLNEMGITNVLVPNENSSLGRSVAAFDSVADPEDDEEDDDIGAFADFMRSSQAPPREIEIINQFAADIIAGRALFMSMPTIAPAIIPETHTKFSCSACHVPTILTARPCTPINNGQFTVPLALGNKIFHPFSDFLLHDVGTGDGIVQNGGQSTRLKLRTPALWGVRTRTRLMHDGESLTFREAILRHQGEAAPVTAAFQLLTDTQKRQLIMFLESL